jgi:hypothetical protein
MSATIVIPATLKGSAMFHVNPLPRIWLALCALMIAFVLMNAAGCSALGVPTAENTDERIVFTIKGIETARDTAAVLLARNKITVADARNLQTQADNLRAGVEVAREMSKNNTVGADQKLVAVRTALLALQAYLTEKEK